MDAFDPDQLHLHDAALQTMRMADPDRAEEIIRDAFGAGGSNWTGWDGQFIDFIEEHRRKGLIYGTVGDGWHFLFCPCDSKGIWICLREGMTGKGLLRTATVVALTEVAVEKGLYELPRPEYE